MVQRLYGNTSEDNQQLFIGALKNISEEIGKIWFYVIIMKTM